MDMMVLPSQLARAPNNGVWPPITAVSALLQATPIAIHTLMNVEGLTLDHIRSHLQKRRRRWREDGHPNDVGELG